MGVHVRLPNDRNSYQSRVSSQKCSTRCWHVTFLLNHVALFIARCRFVAYRAVLQHQDSWQNVGVVLASKADVGAFILDMSKTLKMGCTTPSVPVEMTFKPSPRDVVGGSEDDEAETPLSVKSLRTLFGESKKIN